MLFHPLIAPKALAPRLMLAMIVTGFIGCNRSPPTTRTYAIGRQNGMVAMTLGSVTVLFEAIPNPGPDEPTWMKGFIQVAGPGTGGEDMGVNNVQMKYTFTPELKRLTIGDQIFDIIDNGQSLKVDGKTYSLDQKRRIVLSKEGKVKSD